MSTSRIEEWVFRVPALAGLLAVLTVAGCARGPGSSLRAPDFDRPPIILVNIDTLRADHLGAYGYSRDTSPHLDAFAAESARFAWAFSQAPSTAPSQASILSGRYPRAHGRQLGIERVDEAVVTLAEALGGAGYRTAAFVDGGLMAAGAGLEQGFELYDDQAGRLRKIGPRATAWIDQYLQQPGRRPFFLMVHTYDVHAPYEQTPARFRQRYLDQVVPKPSRFFRQRPTNKILRVHAGEDSLSPAEIDYSIALYDGGIRHVDAWFGGFRRFLEHRGLWRQSLVVVISDHGEEFVEHGQVFHNQLYSAITHIPLMIRFPGGRFAGRVEDSVVESLDLMPTLLEAAGVQIPGGVQGQSLVPLLEGEGRRSLAISECSGQCRQLAITTELWRLVIDQRRGQEQLFRYRQDRLEQDDLAATEPARAASLAKALQGWEKRARRTESGAVTYSDETLQQLSALGYVDTVRSLSPPPEHAATPETGADPAAENPAAEHRPLFEDDFESGTTEAWRPP